MTTPTPSDTVTEAGLNGLFGGEQIMLDHFQLKLMRMADTASKNALSQFFNKNHEPLYRFLLGLYIASLGREHPARKREVKKDEDDGLNTAEQSILAGWAELMTESPPSAFVIQADGTFAEMRLDEAGSGFMEVSTDPSSGSDGPEEDAESDSAIAMFKEGLKEQTDSRKAEITPRESASVAELDKHDRGDPTHGRAVSAGYHMPRKQSIRTARTPVSQMALMWGTLNGTTSAALTAAKTASLATSKKGKRGAKSPKPKPLKSPKSPKSETTTVKLKSPRGKVKTTSSSVDEPIRDSSGTVIKRSTELSATGEALLPKSSSLRSEISDMSTPHHSPAWSVGSFATTHRDRMSSAGSFGSLAMMGTGLALIRDTSIRGKYNPALLMHTPSYSFSYAHSGADTGDTDLLPGYYDDEEDSKKEYVGVDDEELAGDSEEAVLTHRRRGTLRGSIWEGVLDAEHVIKSPLAPVYRTRVDVSLEMTEINMLDCLLRTISMTSSRSRRAGKVTSLGQEILVTSTEAFCIFLPLMAVVAINESDKGKQKHLVKAIMDRCRTEPDSSQAMDCLIASQSKEYAPAYDVFKLGRSRDRRRAGGDLTETAKALSPKSGMSDMPSLSDLSAAVTDAKRTESTSSTSGPVCIVQAIPESAPVFFASLFKKKYKGGSEIKMNAASEVRDPVREGVPPLSKVHIRRVIASNSKPLLIDLYVNDKVDDFEFLSSTMILKLGDDLKRDRAVLDCFRLMNRIWTQKGLEFSEYPVQAYTYKAVAMGAELGAIELVPGCRPLRLVGEMEKSMSISMAQSFNLVASAAGSYIASFVMGIRDRHFDNVLLRETDCMLFHIDFGFVMGEKASLDTSQFAITQDLKSLMGDHWSDFVKISVVAFLQLRERHTEVITYARAAFQHVLEGDAVESFLRKQLMLGEPDEKAAKRISAKLKKSPDSVRTKFKNVIHDIATKVKRT